MTDHDLIIKKLKRRYYSALDWAGETGSTKLTSRISELRAEGHSFKVRELRTKDGKKFLKYKYIGKAA